MKACQFTREDHVLEGARPCQSAHLARKKGVGIRECMQHETLCRWKARAQLGRREENAKTERGYG